ncbi:unnamed protein product [Oppiella nova]|uniref:Nuclear transcription factor Y subunit gamma n=1 Tax=Oppiella nova TaxID=334625 RepID=A0A7R9MB06_9ACAR|nr:unnamed protein product [Oppiella nova]CAG2174073.1 unnamed protein product [Oppiella nova]
MTDNFNSHSNETNAANSEAQQMLDTFWHREIDNIKNLGQNDFKNQELPLARIKKIMKLDDDVKMISAEAPVLFAKAAEIFITEISLRAWIHTEDNKRRTLQRNDIAMAITKYDQFDFLIDIVPRDELKPNTKRQENDALRSAVTTTQTVHPDQVQYYLQLAQQHQQALQHQGPQQTQQIQILQTGATAGGQPQFAVSPQLVQVQVPQQTNNAGGDGHTVQPTTQVLQIQAPNATSNQKTGQIQIVQNVINANGEVVQQQIPIQAWIHTEDNKRRTLQRNDIAMAITKYDQFDFLIDIVPRDELKPNTKRQENDALRSAVTTTQTVHPDQVQYYLQLAQQHQQALQHQGPQQTQQIQILQTGATAGGQPQFAVSPQLVQVQVPQQTNNAGGDGHTVQPTTQVLQIQAPNATSNQKTGQIQIVQNVINANGEVVQQQIPIQLSAQQIQALLQGQAGGQAGANQPIILTSPLQQAMSMPQYQIATSAAGTQFLQTVVSGGTTNVAGGLTQHQTDSSPQLDDESNET